MNVVERVVFDCNVYFQAVISPSGPAGRCFAEALEGRLILFASQHVINEFQDVCLRPHIASRFRLTETRVDAFVAEIVNTATLIDNVPHVFDFERDPDDAHYSDLAVASNATLSVLRDREPLALNVPR